MFTKAFLWFDKHSKAAMVVLGVIFIIITVLGVLL